MRDGAVLVAQRPVGKHHAGLWELPGGKVEAGESLIEALQRELREELGVKSFVSGDALYLDASPENDLTIHFLPAILEGEPQALEHAALAWLPAHDLVNVPLAPADRRFVSHWLNPGFRNETRGPGPTTTR